MSRSTIGRTMRALADDRALAAIAGVRVGRVIVYTWILSGLLAGLAGVLAGLIQTSFDPNFGFPLLLPVFAAVVLGGIGSAYGALAGGLALGVAMELSTWPSLLGGVNPVYKPVVAFTVLIAALMVRPQGLFGRARVV
jgi:branched-subunit amino acid ABC-type transport system permease component